MLVLSLPEWVHHGYWHHQPVYSSNNMPEELLLGIGTPVDAVVFQHQGSTLKLKSYVTNIGPLPSNEKVTSSLFWTLIMNDEHARETMSDDEKKLFIQQYLGALPGQCVTAIGWCHEQNATTASGDGGNDSIKVGDLVETVYELDDNLFYPWKIVGLRKLGVLEVIAALNTRTTTADGGNAVAMMLPPALTARMEQWLLGQQQQ